MAVLPCGTVVPILNTAVNGPCRLHVVLMGRKWCRVSITAIVEGQSKTDFGDLNSDILALIVMNLTVTNPIMKVGTTYHKPAQEGTLLPLSAVQRGNKCPHLEPTENIMELAFLCITMPIAGFLLGYYILGPLLYGE